MLTVADMRREKIPMKNKQEFFTFLYPLLSVWFGFNFCAEGLEFHH